MVAGSIPTIFLTTASASDYLNPGAWNTIANSQLGYGADRNISNALLHKGDARSLIENANGGAGANTIIGNQGANILSGNGGNDRISGRDGMDTLSGNEGADTFVFISTTASTPTSPDTIQDFVAGTDRIDLRTIDANATLLSNQASSISTTPPSPALQAS
jgi:Ca2+-binding RTX toxin-like protein